MVFVFCQKWQPKPIEAQCLSSFTPTDSHQVQRSFLSLFKLEMMAESHIIMEASDIEVLRFRMKFVKNGQIIRAILSSGIILVAKVVEYYSFDVLPALILLERKGKEEIVELDDLCDFSVT